MVILNGYKTITEAMVTEGDAFVGRPQFGGIKLVTRGFGNTIAIILTSYYTTY